MDNFFITDSRTQRNTKHVTQTFTPVQAWRTGMFELWHISYRIV